MRSENYPSAHVMGWMVSAHPSFRIAENIPILDTLQQDEQSVTKDEGRGGVWRDSVERVLNSMPGVQSVQGLPRTPPRRHEEFREVRNPAIRVAPFCRVPPRHGKEQKGRSNEAAMGSAAQKTFVGGFAGGGAGWEPARARTRAGIRT